MLSLGIISNVEGALSEYSLCVLLLILANEIFAVFIVSLL